MRAIEAARGEERIQHLAIVGFFEEVEQGIGNFRPDAGCLDGRDDGFVAALEELTLRFGGGWHDRRSRSKRALDHLLESGPAAIAAGEVARGDFTNMADAEREQEPVERRRSLRVDRRDQVGG